MFNNTTNSKLTCEVFFSRRFPASVAYAKDLLTYLGERQLDCNAYEIEEATERWARTGLRSIPSILFQVNGEPVSNLVRYATFEQVLTRAQQCHSTAPEPVAWRPSTPAPAETAPASLGSPLPYAVVGSSGCHRYERWNEHAVVDEDPATGWVCPALKPGEHEFLHFDFQTRVDLTALILKPRVRTDGTPSYKSFPKHLSVYARLNSHWKKVHEDRDIFLEDVTREFVIQLRPAVQCREVKVVIDEKHDIDGKTFPCIASARCFGKPLENDRPGFVRYALSQQHNANVFFKTGVFARDNIRIELHNLLRDQSTPANFSNRHKVLIPLEGHVEVKVDGKTTVARRGEVVIIRPLHPFQVRGLKKSNRLMVVFQWEGLQSFWESR